MGRENTAHPLQPCCSLTIRCDALLSECGGTAEMFHTALRKRPRHSANSCGPALRSPFRTTSADNRPSPYPCTGPGTVCPWACNSPAGTRTRPRCCAWPGSSKRPGPGSTGNRRCVRNPSLGPEGPLLSLSKDRPSGHDYLKRRIDQDNPR